MIYIDSAKLFISVPLKYCEEKGLRLASEIVADAIHEHCQPVPENLHMQVSLLNWDDVAQVADYHIFVFGEEDFLNRIRWIADLFTCERRVGLSN